MILELLEVSQLTGQKASVSRRLLNVFPSIIASIAGEKFVVGIRFHDKTLPAFGEGSPHHLQVKLLAQEKYFGFRSNSANSPGGFDPGDFRQSDIQQDQVRLQNFSLQHRFQTVRYNADNAIAAILTQLFDQESSPLRAIIHHENANKRIVADSPLLFRVQNQAYGVMVVN